MVPINLLKRYTLCGTANLIRDDMYYPDDVPCYKTGSRYENCSSTEITVASISNPCGRYQSLTFYLPSLETIYARLCV